MGWVTSINLFIDEKTENIELQIHWFSHDLSKNRFKSIDVEKLNVKINKKQNSKRKAEESTYPRKSEKAALTGRLEYLRQTLVTTTPRRKSICAF